VNGELRARSGPGWLRAHTGIRELPATYVVVLRDGGAIYYAASLPGAPGFAAAPALRPVGVDVHAADPSADPGAAPGGDADLVYAGVHQAVHAESGHEMATRVWAVQVADIDGWADWAATAVAADRFGTATGNLDGADATRGGPWRVVDGSVRRDAAGALAVGDGPRATAVLWPAEPAGLVHVEAATAAVMGPGGAIGLRWRTAPDGVDGWEVMVHRDDAELAVTVDGARRVVAHDVTALPAAATVSLQVLDDGRHQRVHLDGAPLFGPGVADERLAGNTGVGFVTGPGRCVAVRAFEAHPRAVEAPSGLHIEPLWAERGTEAAVADAFEDGPGELAAVSRDRAGEPRWERSLGEGWLDLVGRGALRARADRLRPNPGRTLYTVAWDDPRFADLEVTLLPPGSARSQGQGSRGGLVFWQDPDNYVLTNVWLDDSPHHDGSAVSLFVRAHGEERITDAVWANVGRDVTWGQRSRLRASFDGERILVWLDDEAVLFRATTDIAPRAMPLDIRRVGLAVNREWGDDTGTEFMNFITRRRAR
jgi:hypothetical protein